MDPTSRGSNNCRSFTDAPWSHGYGDAQRHTLGDRYGTSAFAVCWHLLYLSGFWLAGWEWQLQITSTGQVSEDHRWVGLHSSLRKKNENTKYGWPVGDTEKWVARGWRPEHRGNHKCPLMRKSDVSVMSWCSAKLASARLLRIFTFSGKEWQMQQVCVP